MVTFYIPSEDKLKDKYPRHNNTYLFCLTRLDLKINVYYYYEGTLCFRGILLVKQSTIPGPYKHNNTYSL